MEYSHNWDELDKEGILSWLNTQAMQYGWIIYRVYDGEGKLVEVYPARVTHVEEAWHDKE